MEVSKENILKKINIAGEIIIYLFVFSMFIDSKLTMKIGYVLQGLSLIKIGLDYKNIKLKGIVMEYGGETSHLAILAKARKYLLLMGIKNIFSYDWKKDVILDTTEQNSCVIIEPDEKTLEEYKDKIEKFNCKREEIEKSAFLPAVTLDGVNVSLNMNISGKTTKEEIDAVTPDGIGLLRTELLYMKNNSFPDEEEQIASYNDIIKI